MTITLDLRLEIERGLLAQAEAKGISLADHVREIVAREAQASIAEAPKPFRTGQALVDVCAEVRGLLTAEEIDTMFARNRSVTQPVNS